MVLGPTEDGEAYLLGARPTALDWFDGIPWGTSRVAASLRARAAAQDWRLAELPPWHGVRRVEDLPRVCDDLLQSGDSLLAGPWLPYLHRLAAAEARRP